jgi:hypothetical protein
MTDPLPDPAIEGLPITSASPSAAQVVAALKRLREPFTGNALSKLPKSIQKAAPGEKPTYLDCKPGTQASADGVFCGGRHPRSIHLDYVGHAALTDRLLEVDLLWDWEPLAIDENGLPQFDRNGGMWIKLTVAGVSRLGYGDAQGKTGPNAVKEAIGDALRNAGMRFGAALDLWHKGDLHDAAAEQGQAAPDGTPMEPEPDQPGRNWVQEVIDDGTTSGYITLFEEAKRLKVPRETLALMRAEATKIKKREDEAEAEAKRAGEVAAEAEANAADAVAASFSGAAAPATEPAAAPTEGQQ